MTNFFDSNANSASDSNLVSIEDINTAKQTLEFLNKQFNAVLDGIKDNKNPSVELQTALKEACDAIEQLKNRIQNAEKRISLYASP